MPVDPVRVRKVSRTPTLRWEGLLLTMSDDTLPGFPVLIEWVREYKGRENLSLAEFQEQCEIIDPAPNKYIP